MFFSVSLYESLRILDNGLKVGGYDGWVGLWKSHCSFFYSFEKFVGECFFFESGLNERRVLEVLKGGF